MNSASLCSLVGRYDSPIPTRFLTLIDCLKIPAQSSLYRYNKRYIEITHAPFSLVLRKEYCILTVLREILTQYITFKFDRGG
jgi:hypothetical protein